jgi:hypothetical protein
MESYIIKMVTFIKVNLIMIWNKVMDKLFIIIMELIMDFSNMMKKKYLEFIKISMVKYMLDNIA